MQFFGGGTVVSCANRRLFGLADQFDVDSHSQIGLATAQCDPAHGTDFAVVAADTNGNMVGIGHTSIGRINLDPAKFVAVINPNPGM